MKTTRRVLIGLFATAVMACAQPPAQQLTKNMSNGRRWAALSFEQRVFLINGIMEGLAMTDKADSYVAESSTVGEIVTALNQFYQDPANAAIPIIDGMIWFRHKVHGDSPESLAAIVASMRSNATTRP